MMVLERAVPTRRSISTASPTLRQVALVALFVAALPGCASSGPSREKILEQHATATQELIQALKSNQRLQKENREVRGTLDRLQEEDSKARLVVELQDERARLSASLEKERKRTQSLERRVANLESKLTSQEHKPGEGSRSSSGRNWFTRGDTRAQVIAVQGQPASVKRWEILDEEIWTYGSYSKVTFYIRSGKVKDWDTSDVRLKARVSP